MTWAVTDSRTSPSLNRCFRSGLTRFAPLTCLTGAIGNLPRDRTSFVGRERLVDDVAAALARSPAGHPGRRGRGWEDSVGDSRGPSVRRVIG